MHHTLGDIIGDILAVAYQMSLLKQNSKKLTDNMDQGTSAGKYY